MTRTLRQQAVALGEPWAVWAAFTCPTCGLGTSALEIQGDGLVGSCGHRFAVHDGIPVLLPAAVDGPGPPGATVGARRSPTHDLTVVIPALDEAANLALLLPDLTDVLTSLHASYEVIVVTGKGDPDTDRVVATAGDRVRVVRQRASGYGSAIRTGIDAADARFILTMDADLSHRPDFLRLMWERRDTAELIIASRYVPGGRATMPLARLLLSRTLNLFFRRGLSLTVRDMSSGYRLMRADAVRELELSRHAFDLLQEILVKAYCQGWRVAEVPFDYEPRRNGRSHARVLPFGIMYLRTFRRLWRLRNSVDSADYDDRAYDSSIPMQRYWQRTRYRHITQLLGRTDPVLAVGYGSSRIVEAFAPGSVAVDGHISKLRHARRFDVPGVVASALALPFADGAFTRVLASDVIEQFPKDSRVLDELCRVLKPGGRLVLGTADYSSRLWRGLETVHARIASGGYAEKHIAHYSRAQLIAAVRKRGLAFEKGHSVLGAEVILAFRKPPTKER